MGKGKVSGRVETKIGKERGCLVRGTGRVVVGELGDREQRLPIILLIVAIHAEVLFQDAVYSLCLAIGLGVEWI